MGRHDEALAHYEKALALRPRHLAVLNRKGNALVAWDGRMMRLQLYDSALAIDPDNAEVLSNRSVALLTLGAPRSAAKLRRGAENHAALCRCAL